MLFYLRNGDPVDTIFAARLSFEPEVTVWETVPVYVGPLEEFDTMPDGRRLVITEYVTGRALDRAGPQQSFVVVFNWFDEVRRRLAEAGG